METLEDESSPIVQIATTKPSFSSQNYSAVWPNNDSDLDNLDDSDIVKTTSAHNSLELGIYISLLNCVFIY